MMGWECKDLKKFVQVKVQDIKICTYYCAIIPGINKIINGWYTINFVKFDLFLHSPYLAAILY